MIYRCRHFRKALERAANPATMARVASPPATTLVTVPNQAAVQPDSTAPNWFEELMNMPWTLDTRPRNSSGVLVCTTELRSTNAHVIAGADQHQHREGKP